MASRAIANGWPLVAGNPPQRLLPALPLPTGAKVAAMGNSIIGYNNYTGSAVPASDGACSSYAYGAIAQALAADPRFNFDSWYDVTDPTGRNISGANQGIFGDHLSWTTNGGGIVGRLPALLARRPGVLILEGGTNTINSGDVTGDASSASAAYVIAQLDKALKLARAAGVHCILPTITPRGDWPNGDPRYQAILDVNTWIRAQAGRESVLGIWDSWDVLAPGGVLDPAAFFGDKIHPNHIGADRMATQGASPLLPMLQAAIAAGTTFDTNPATSNLLGVSNGNLAGTTGTKAGTAVTGTNATNTVVRGGASGAAPAIACSLETVSGSIQRQVLTISPYDDGGATRYWTCTVDLPSSNIGGTAPVAGTWVQHALLIETDAVGAISCSRLQAQVTQSSTARVQSYAGNMFSAEFTQSARGNRIYWLLTKPMYIPAGTALDRVRSFLNLYWPKGTGSQFTVRYSRPIWRTVPDPRPAWGY